MKRYWGGMAAAIVGIGIVGLVSVQPVIAGKVAVQTAAASDHKTGGFLLGCQAWCFNHYTVMEAIEKAAQTGGKTIEFFPGQALSPDHRDIHFGAGVSDDIIPYTS